jgi:aminopeptidase
MKQSYRPSDEILAKYAELLVKFGLQTRDGKQLHKGAVVQFRVPEVAKPMYWHLQTAILKAGYQPLGVFLPSDDENYKFDKGFYDSASKAQLEFTPHESDEAVVQQIDANIRILADTDLHSLDTIDPKAVMLRTNKLQQAKKPYYDKIDRGELLWTLALYGTEVLAKEAGMTLKAYWNQIINACYLDSASPIAEWKKITKSTQRTAQKLTDLQIKSLHMVGSDVDLHIGIGNNRSWKAGSGCNIPSYEVFTSPNSHEINGSILFNQPLFRYGKRIENIKLQFINGKVVKSSATKNEALLKEMLKVKNGNQVGEFSLTDARLSRITKFMAETLYDENVGGKFGNSHLALGFCFKECFVGDSSKFTDEKWDQLGFNQSSLHNDIVTTTDRTVTATFYDGTEQVIYKNGQFTI